MPSALFSICQLSLLCLLFWEIPIVHINRIILHHYYNLPYHHYPQLAFAYSVDVDTAALSNLIYAIDNRPLPDAFAPTTAV